MDPMLTVLTTCAWVVVVVVVGCSVVVGASVVVVETSVVGVVVSGAVSGASIAVDVAVEEPLTSDVVVVARVVGVELDVVSAVSLVSVPVHATAMLPSTMKMTVRNVDCLMAVDTDTGIARNQDSLHGYSSVASTAMFLRWPVRRES